MTSREASVWGKVASSLNSLLLAVHGQGDVGVIELNVNIVGNQLMELFHSFSLDEFSGFEP